MKKINLKLYIMSFLFFFWGILSYYLTKWVHEYFINVFIWIILTIWLFNTSSILFYKTLKSDDEILKYIFSFLNILVLILFTFILLPKIG